MVYGRKENGRLRIKRTSSINIYVSLGRTLSYKRIIMPLLYTRVYSDKNRTVQVLLLFRYLCAAGEMSIFLSPLLYIILAPSLIPTVDAVSTRWFRFTCYPPYHRSTQYYPQTANTRQFDSPLVIVFFIFNSARHLRRENVMP